MQSFHLKADLDEVMAVIGDLLERDGFAPCDEDPDDPSVRRIAFYSQGEWAGFAEERTATKEWGPALSESLGAEVITLEGECDHAFYTHVFVHQNGEVLHAARVPEDVTLDDDGQHRIRPKFLPHPIVVNELGGEENMQAIGEVMGIPRPLFSVYDEDVALTLSVRYTSDAAPKHDLAALFGSEFGGTFGAEVAAALGGLKVVRSEKTGGPPRLVRCTQSRTEKGFASEQMRVHGTFLLDDGESARGVNVSLYGDGLALFEATQIRARVADREWSAEPVVRDGMVTFTLPDVELTQPAARPSTDHLPLEERLRQGMKRLTTQSIMSNPSEVTVWIEGRLLGAGEGELALTAEIAGVPNSADTTEIALVVEPALRRPLLPRNATMKDLHPAYIEQYEGRDVAFGWFAFDAPWADVRDVVLQIAREAEQVVLEATGAKEMSATAQLRDGKRLTLKKDLWPKIEQALAKGADVNLMAGEHFHGASIDVVHQLEGPNFISSLKWEGDRPPPVWLAWWCPRPQSEAGVRALVRLADRAFELALPKAIAGLASAQKEYSFGNFETAYERLAGIGRGTVATLKARPRAPGWRVLLPLDAKERIVKSSAPDPFSYSSEDAAEMERQIVPLMD